MTLAQLVAVPLFLVACAPADGPVSPAPPTRASQPTNTPTKDPTPVKFGVQIYGSIIDKRASTDDEGKTCSSDRVKAGTLITFHGTRTDTARLTGGEPNEDLDCAFRFIVADALTDDSGGDLAVEVSGKIFSWHVSEGELEQRPTFVLPAGWTAPERSYLKSQDVDQDDDDANDTVKGGREACRTYGEYSGDQLTAYLIEAGPSIDEAAIKYFCPKVSPALRASTRGFTDGDYSVGDDVAPGTYRTLKKVQDCYWERVTDGGQTIANDFASYAPKGITVTIQRSDGGFKSERCGVWLKQ